MKTSSSLLCLLFLAAVSGCSVFRGPPGPKAYDNALVVIDSGSAAGREDMVRVTHSRLDGLTRSELASQGDLKVVAECGPRTLKITQDIQSVGESSTLGKRRGWGKRGLELRSGIQVYINTTVEDCETGKQFESFTYNNSGENLVDVLQTLASWNVAEAYRYQHGPRR